VLPIGFYMYIYIYIYIFVDVIKTLVLEFYFGCFKIKVLCVLLVGDMWV
jgi:hypothetical protein